MNGKIKILLLHLLCKKIPDFLKEKTQISGSVFQFCHTVFNTAHFKDIVDQCKQVLPGRVNLAEILMNLLQRRLFACEIRITYDGIHGRTDIVGHIEKKLAFCKAGFHSADLLTLGNLVLFPHHILDIQHDHEPDKDDEQQNNAADGQGRTNFPDGILPCQKFCDPHQGRIYQQNKQNGAGN